MPFFKIEMEGGYFDYLIIEGETDECAYDIAVGELPSNFGEPTGNPEEVENPLAECYPIFTNAWIKAVYESRERRLNERYGEPREKQAATKKKVATKP